MVLNKNELLELKYLKDNWKKIDQIRQLINQTNGKFFTIKFIKANGEIRKMTCRIGVKKNIKGTYKKRNIENYIVYEMNKSDYRTIPLSRVLEFKFKGIYKEFYEGILKKYSSKIKQELYE